MKQPFPECLPLPSQDIQRIRPQHHHAHFNLHDIYNSSDTLHRKSHSINSILRPTSTLSDSTQYLPRRRPTISHDSSTKHLLPIRNIQQEQAHQLNPTLGKPRSNSLSIHPKPPSIGNLHVSNQLKSQKSSSSLRSKTPVLNESTESLVSNLNLNANRSSSSLINTSSYYHSQQQQRYPTTRQQQPSKHRPTFIPVNSQNHHHHHHHNVSNIGSIKNSLVESIHNFPCSLQDKLFFVAKLHAEVEAELTKLDMLPSGRSLSTHTSDNSINKTRQEIDDPVHLIELSDRINALAVSQLKQDLYR